MEDLQLKYLQNLLNKYQVEDREYRHVADRIVNLIEDYINLDEISYNDMIILKYKITYLIKDELGERGLLKIT